MPPLLRWLLVLPATLASVLAGVLLSFFLFRGLLLALCPAEPGAALGCAEPWFFHAELAVDALGAGVAAFLAMVLAAALAPAHRMRTAVLALLFTLLCSVTILVLIAVELPIPLAGAALGAALGFVVVRRIERAAAG